MLSKCDPGIIVRVGLTPPDHCRHITLGLDWTSLVLLLLMHVMFSLYRIQIESLFHLVRNVWMGTVYGKADEDRWLAVNYLIWTASVGFPIWYSFEMLFLYINDDWYLRYEWQLCFTLMEVLQFFCCHQILTVRNHLIEGSNVERKAPKQDGTLTVGPHPLLLYSTIGVTVFVFAFNIVVELWSTHTVGVRNILHLTGDVVTMFVALRYYFSRDDLNQRRAFFVVAVWVVVFSIVFTATKRIAA